MYTNQYFYQLFKLVFAINLLLTISAPVGAEKVNSSTSKPRNSTSQPHRNQVTNRNNRNRKRNIQHTNQNRKPLINLVYFRQPQRQGTPQGTRPAGSRNNCTIDEKIRLTALVPLSKKADGRELRWGLTTKEYPTFWFYVPHTLKFVKNTKFSLRNRKNQTIYEKKIQLDSTPGVIRISLPANVPALKIGEWYQYYLFMDVDCNSKGLFRKKFAKAWIKREAIDANLEAQLQRISTRQRGFLYAKNGIWYDAMVSFAKLKYAQNNNSEWKQMLDLIGLGDISQVPVIKCCD